jgi:hypothetical protein
VRLSLRNRIIVTAIFLIVALAATALGAALLKIDASEAESRVEDLQRELENLNDPLFIFGNNFFHSLVMFAPFVGPGWGCFVLFNTGTIIAVFGVAQGLPPVLLLVLLMFTPVFWLEYGVYSVAMAQSTIFVLKMLRGEGRKEAARTCVLVTACALVLLLSALIEWFMIN